MRFTHCGRMIIHSVRRREKASDSAASHWPKGIDDHGAVRGQFHYVTDIAPTIYELVGVEAPDTYRGVPQIPVAGTSMAQPFLCDSTYGTAAPPEMVRDAE